MALAEDLLAILVCPESKKPLIYFPAGEDGADPNTEFLFCPTSRLRYRVDEGIPIMLIDEAERLSEDDGQRLVAQARLLGLPASE